MHRRTGASRGRAERGGARRTRAQRIRMGAANKDRRGGQGRVARGGVRRTRTSAALREKTRRASGRGRGQEDGDRRDSTRKRTGGRGASVLN